MTIESSTAAAASAGAPRRVLYANATLTTLAGDRDWGLVNDGALLVEGEQLRWVGPMADLPADLRDSAGELRDLGGLLVTPGLIDCHTHLVYGGERSAEFELRLQGAAYEEIARAGGGIRSTVAATRAASEPTLHALAVARARALMAEGLTTLEVKSGYGLSLADEAKCLRVARQLGELGLTVKTTYLGAHALPPNSTAVRTITSTPSARGCRSCISRAWSMRSMPSANASASRRSRRVACSRRPARSACR